MSLLFDLILILILAFSVIVGAKKGFAFSVANLVSLVVCLGLAYLCCSVLAMPLYNNLIKEKNISTSKKIAEEYVPNEKLRNFIAESKSEAEINDFVNRSSDIKEEIILKIENIIGSDGNRKGIEQGGKIIDKIIPDEKLTETVVMLVTKPPDVAAAYIEENYLRPPSLLVLRVVIFLIMFAILSLIFGFLVRIFIKKMPVLKSADMLLGAVFGIVYGFVVIVGLCLVFKFAIYMTEDTLEFLNSNNIANSKLMSKVYSLVTR
ncbi:MAG: CvpA family protein [Ruminococcus sp.]|nr:CvpA family protein [Ruminococcus sp.]